MRFLNKKGPCLLALTAAAAMAMSACGTAAADLLRTPAESAQSASASISDSSTTDSLADSKTAGIAILPQRAKLAVGERGVLTVSADTLSAGTAAAVWDSSNKAVATVDGEGRVTALSEGSTTILISLGGQSASCALAVFSTAAAKGEDTSDAVDVGVGSAMEGEPISRVVSEPESSSEEKRENAERQAAWEQINGYRTAVGLEPLVWDEGLGEVAAVRAEEIVTNFSHEGARTAGEIIASGYDSPTSVCTAWANSSGHYAVMTGDFSVGAVAVVYDASGTSYWVGVFN